MKKIIVLSLFVLTLVLSAKTTTDVTLQTPYEEGQVQNDYGDKIMYQNVKINTQNFKINNFWGKFSDAAQDQSNFTNIATAANVKLTIENSFTCKDGGLPEEGCSGQKPFLINQGTLGNSELTKDAMGQNLPAGEYRIPFDSATNYNSLNNDAFYVLDVFRDGKYYQDNHTNDYNNAKPKTFFGYMVKLIKTYFSPQNDTTIISALTQNTVEARNRYMANIIFGLQQSYRIKKESGINTNSINQASTTKQPSLLDYNALMINDTTGCDGIFFTFSPNSITCKFQNFFGMSQWMPFFGNGASLLGENTSTSSIQSDSVLEDTETTLLTLASKLDNTNYVQPEIDQNTGRFPILSEIFKPMTFMAKSMFRFFFGANSKNLTEIVSVDFNFINHMPLTFIKTDGEKALDFVYFELLGLESVYGTEVQECTVGLRSSIDPFGFFASEETFTEGKSNYIYLKTGGSYKKFPTADWLDWCKKHQTDRTKGIIGRLLDSIGKIFGNTTNPVSYNELDNLLSNKSWKKKAFSDHKYKEPYIISKKWKVKSYKEKVHKGLILHLKKIDIDDINSSTPGTTTEYKVMKVSRGNQSNNNQNSNNQSKGMH